MKRKHPGFQPKEVHKHEALHFPKSFLWGSATSAHQVEGWNENNDWWEWEHKEGTITNGQLSGRAADHYHQFMNDFALAEELNQNVHRLSIEWSRICPEAGEYDQKQVDHYLMVLQDLKRRNIKIMLTLHHFTNPIWFAEIGGFEKAKNIRHFLDYVNFILPQVAPYVDFWI